MIYMTMDNGEPKFDRELGGRMNHLNEFQSLRHVHFLHGIWVGVAMVAMLVV